MLGNKFFSIKNLVIFGLIAAAGCPSFAAEKPVEASGAAGHDIVHESPWRQGNMEQVMADAKREQKPVLIYWGAVWCPPCNELKAEVFSHPKFNELIKPMIAVYLDGDQEHAQKWGEKLKIKGYPTVLLLGPQGDEWMRLTASTDFRDFEKSLSSAVSASGMISEALARAESGKGSAADWQLLAYNRWFDAPALQLTPDAVIAKHASLIGAIPETLKIERALLAAEGLAAVASAASATNAVEPVKSGSTALQVARSKSEEDEFKKLEAALALVRGNVPAWLNTVLADPETVRSASGFLIYQSADLVSWLEPAQNDARQKMETSIVSAMKELSAQTTISPGIRMWSIKPKVQFALKKAGSKASLLNLPAELVNEVRAAVAQADHDAVSSYDRHAVISDAADLLDQIGDVAGARELLVRELKKTNTPWYYQGSLANLEKNANRKTQALKWSSAARVSAKGRATRIQWIVSDLMMNSDLLLPTNKKDVSHFVKIVTLYYDAALSEVDGFSGRNNARAKKVVKGVTPWLTQKKVQAVISAAEKKCASLANGNEGCREHFAEFKDARVL
jgi:protein disulfide-isomerase